LRVKGLLQLLASDDALLDEQLGLLAAKLGREEEARFWQARSEERISRMLERYWNGKRFVGYTPEGDVLDTESLVFFRPLILGERLPEQVRRAMAEELSEGNGYLCGAGLLTQRLTSPEFDRLRPCGGRVSPAETALIARGLCDAGYPELGKTAATRCRDALEKGASPFWPLSPGFPDAETAAAYRLLCEIAK